MIWTKIHLVSILYGDLWDNEILMPSVLSIESIKKVGKCSNAGNKKLQCYSIVVSWMAFTQKEVEILK